MFAKPDFDNLLDMSGKVAIVTGGSRGIGQSIAQGFAARGASVAVHYHRNRDAAEETLRTLPGGPHHLLAANLADPEATRDLVSRAVEACGRIDVLANNAGVFTEHSPRRVGLDEWDEAWEHTLGVNLVAPARLMFLVARHMKEHGGGRIVNVSSRGAFRGEPDAPAYGASKAGLNAASQSLAKAFGPDGIQVFVVAPGWVETDMAASHLSDERGAAIRNETALGRVATPEEVARIVVFLGTEGPESMTGCVIDVNGASYLRT